MLVSFKQNLRGTAPPPPKKKSWSMSLQSAPWLTAFEASRTILFTQQAAQLPYLVNLQCVSSQKLQGLPGRLTLSSFSPRHLVVNHHHHQPTTHPSVSLSKRKMSIKWWSQIKALYVLLPSDVLPKPIALNDLNKHITHAPYSIQLLCFQCGLHNINHSYVGCDILLVLLRLSFTDLSICPTFIGGWNVV